MGLSGLKMWPLTSPFPYTTMQSAAVYLLSSRPSVTLTSQATTSNTLIQGYTGPKSTIPVASVDERITSFLSNMTATSAIDMSSALFVIFSGLNDIFFNPNLTTIQTVGAISSSVTELQNAGARNFLLMSYLLRCWFDTLRHLRRRDHQAGIASI